MNIVILAVAFVGVGQAQAVQEGNETYLYLRCTGEEQDISGRFKRPMDDIYRVSSTEVAFWAPMSHQWSNLCGKIGIKCEQKVTDAHVRWVLHFPADKLINYPRRNMSVVNRYTGEWIRVSVRADSTPGEQYTIRGRCTKVDPPDQAQKRF